MPTRDRPATTGTLGLWAKALRAKRLDQGLAAVLGCGCRDDPAWSHERFQTIPLERSIRGRYDDIGTIEEPARRRLGVGNRSVDDHQIVIGPEKTEHRVRFEDQIRGGL